MTFAHKRKVNINLRILAPKAVKRKEQNCLQASTLLKNPDNCHHARLGEYAASLWKEKSMIDVMIVVEAREFTCHKAVLACYSPYFKELFVNSGVSNVHYLELPNVSAKAFEILLEYMYTGELVMTCQELWEVYRAARRLGMTEARAKCISLLQVTSDHIENIVYLYVNAKKLGMLNESAINFKSLTSNFERLVMTKEFLDLNIEQMMDVLSVDEIGARSEVVIFLAALKWLNHNYPNREKHIIPLVRCVRFPLMNLEEILACFHPPVLPGIVTIPEIKSSLLDATCYIAAKSLGQVDLFSDLSCKRRKLLLQGETFCLWDTAKYDAETYKIKKRLQAATRIQAAFRGYRTRKEQHEKLYLQNYACTIIQAYYRGYRERKHFHKKKLRRKPASSYISILDKLGTVQSFTALGYKELTEKLDIIIKPCPFYALGAFNVNDEGKGENNILRYDPEKETWEVMTECFQPSLDSKMISFAHSLYIIGGFNPRNRNADGNMIPQESLYRYNLDTKMWTELKPMNNARFFHGAVVFNDTLFTIGGINKTNNILTSIENYNPEKNIWLEVKPQLPEPRMAMGAAVHDQMIWIAGGITGTGHNTRVLDSVLRLDKSFGKWSRIANLPHPIAFPTLVSDGKELLCLGGAVVEGDQGSKKLKSIEFVYKYKKDQWIKFQNMPVQCHSVVACHSGKNLHILGGFKSKTRGHLDDPFYMNKHTNEWFSMSSLPEAAYGHITAATRCDV